MPVMKRRSQIVSFRLSQEEYDAMMQGCILAGARSLSDYARLVACKGLPEANRQPDTLDAAASIRQLRAQVEELSTEVRRLAERIAIDG